MENKFNNLKHADRKGKILKRVCYTFFYKKLIYKKLLDLKKIKNQLSVMRLKENFLKYNINNMKITKFFDILKFPISKNFLAEFCV